MFSCAPDARAAVAKLTEHAIVQQVRTRCAESAAKKLKGDVAKLDAALLSARTKLLAVLFDPGFEQLLESGVKSKG